MLQFWGHQSRSQNKILLAQKCAVTEGRFAKQSLKCMFISPKLLHGFCCQGKNQRIGESQDKSKYREGAKVNKDAEKF